MSDTSKNGFDLSPLDPSDDPRLLRALELLLKEQARKSGQKICEPGEIDPALVENHSVSARVIELTNEKISDQLKAMGRLNSNSLRGVVANTTVEHTIKTTRPDGTIETSTTRVSNALKRVDCQFSVIEQLGKMFDGIVDKTERFFGVCVKLIGAVVAEFRDPRDKSN